MVRELTLPTASLNCSLTFVRPPERLRSVGAVKSVETRAKTCSPSRLKTQKPASVESQSGSGAKKSVNTSKKPPVAQCRLSERSYAAGASDGGVVLSDCAHTPRIASGTSSVSTKRGKTASP